MGFDRDGSRAYMLNIAKLFTAERLDSLRGFGDPDERPVFVVGLPRSGTSLVEQIAASHPAVYGAGEQRGISEIVSLHHAGSAMPRPPWDRETSVRLGQAYMRDVAARAGNASRIIDKSPVNLLHLGYIAAVLPNARVILCRRDPRDTCFSCFSHYFNQELNWTFDQEDCAAYATSAEQLINHWRATPPLPILEVQYEDLIADLEGQSRRLIAFMGLDWDPACLDFHKTERAVFTVSHWQVKQPLYTTSIGRWRKYKPWLTPMLNGLAGILPPGAN